MGQDIPNNTIETTDYEHHGTLIITPLRPPKGLDVTGSRDVAAVAMLTDVMLFADGAGMSQWDVTTAVYAATPDGVPFWETPMPADMAAWFEEPRYGEVSADDVTSDDGEG